MSCISVAPTGRLTQGHVLDVSRRAFDRALRDYDHLLYTKWNPKKLNGWGAWEIRRRPETKCVVDIHEWQGNTIVELGYRELDIVSNVLTCAFLNYDQLRKIQEMDIFAAGGAKGFAERLEAKEAAHRAEQMRKAKESSQYVAKQHKKEIREFKELLASGMNPARIADYWGK